MVVFFLSIYCNRLTGKYIHCKILYNWYNSGKFSQFSTQTNWNIGSTEKYVSAEATIGFNNPGT